VWRDRGRLRETKMDGERERERYIERNKKKERVG